MTVVVEKPVTIAVVDDAIDTRHSEFTGRVAAEFDASTGASSAIPRGRQTHGTKVAGLALAGGRGVKGVAPNARLLAVRVPALSYSLGDPSEGVAIRWAAEHGADIICCAWGPQNPDGRVGRLPRHTQDAIEFAASRGRDGRGCVIVVSAGNDGGDIVNNEYASHRDVIAVGACNCHGKHPRYSPSGDALFCVATSNDPDDPVGALSTYRTTAPVGSFLAGEAFYTDDFGFTSASCAIAAGICARVLAVDPALTALDVRAIIADSCEKVDLEGGSYDGRGHSAQYGYGRIDLDRALQTLYKKTAKPSV